VRLLTGECFVDVNVQNDKLGGEHALLLAAEGGKLEVVKVLVEAGAKVDRTDDRGRSALWLAAR
jgi:ankyrin repeat protein